MASAPAYPNATPAPNAVDPAYDYSHAVGRKIIGGYVYRGTKIRQLRGIYVFADYLGPNGDIVAIGSGEVFKITGGRRR